MSRRLLTVAQAARALQKDAQTVRRLCRTAKLDAVKVGGEWRVRGFGAEWRPGR